MGTLTATLTAAGDVSAPFFVKDGQSVSWIINPGTFTGSVQIQRGVNGGRSAWELVSTSTADASGTIIAEKGAFYRFRLAAITGGDDTVEVSITDATDVVQQWRNSDGTLVLEITDAGVNLPLGGTITGVTIAALVALAMVNDIHFLQSASTPVDYTDGTPPATGEGTAGKGSLCVALDTGKWYTNKGTKAQPIWGIFTSA